MNGNGIKIYRGIYLGDRSVSENFNFFNENKICNVVNVTHDIKNVFEGRKIQIGNKLKTIKYLKIPVVDAQVTNLKQFFDNVSVFIKAAKKKKRNTLIHCEMGRSRSVTTIVAFAMKVGKMKLNRVYTHILKVCQKNNHMILINDGFRRQLMNYELEIFSDLEKNSLDFFPKIRKQKVYDETRLFEQYEIEQLALMKRLEKEEDELVDFDDYEGDEGGRRRSRSQIEEEDEFIIQEENKEEERLTSMIKEDDLDDEEEIEFGDDDEDDENEIKSQEKEPTNQVVEEKEKKDNDEEEEEEEEVEIDKVTPRKRKHIEIEESRSADTGGEKKMEEVVMNEPPEKKRKLNDDEKED